MNPPPFKIQPKSIRIVPRDAKKIQRPAGLPVLPPESSAPAAPTLPPSATTESAPRLINPHTTTLPATATHSADISTTLTDESHKGGPLYRALLRGLYDAILIVDPEGGIVDCNRRARSFFQYEYNALCAMPVMNLISGMSPKILTRIRDNLAAGRFTLLDAYCIRRDGTRFAVEIAISRLTSESREDLVFSVRNVTRRRAMEEQLRTEHNALQNSASGIVIANTQAVIQYANPAFCSLCGQDEPSVIGQQVTSFWTGDTLTEKLVEGPLAGQEWSGEIEGRHVSGRHIRVQATASVNRAPTGKPIGLVYSFVDVTERHEAQMRIQREAEAQMQAVRQQDAFSGRLTIISLTDIIQLIQATGKTGTLCILNETGDVMGEAAFEAGELQSATHDKLQGEAAFMALLTTPGAAFQFDPERKAPRDPGIVKPLMTLLMESAQAIDESNTD